MVVVFPRRLGHKKRKASGRLNVPLRDDWALERDISQIEALDQIGFAARHNKATARPHQPNTVMLYDSSFLIYEILAEVFEAQVLK